MINLQGVFSQEIKKDTLLLQDYLDPKLKHGIIRFREDVCDWLEEKNAFKSPFAETIIMLTGEYFVNVIFTFVRECIWFPHSVVSC